MAAPSIVLLSGAEEGPPLRSLLHAVDPALEIALAHARADFDRLVESLTGPTRLVAFGSGVLVSAAQLRRLGRPAYNIHLGPPTFPGYAPAAFAVLADATRFGATAHVMTERVDEGPIVATEWFQLAPHLTTTDIEILAGAAAARLFHRLAPAFARLAAELPPSGEAWSGRKGTRAQLEALRDAPLQSGTDDFLRRQRALGKD